jgi:anti-sigma regulatory factor (Ser/Thr protein kinase)
MKQTKTFKHRADSVTQARRFVSEVLRDAPAELRDVAVLMVSELASNCIRHTDSDFDLTISHSGDEMCVQTTDYGEGEPRMRTPDPTDPSGRGLQIIDIFSTDWGYETRGREKTVWFKLRVGAQLAEAG